jgi:spore coat protein U-like protein
MRTLLVSAKARSFVALAGVAGAVLLFLPAPTEAACEGTCSATATVSLTATVNANCSVAVVSNSSSGLDLTQNTPPSGTPVAVVREKCNAKSGYSISLASANAGKLKGQSASNPDTLSYSLRYDAADVAFAGAGPVVALTNQPKTTGQGTERTIRIVYSGAAAHLVEDTYADTVTITLTGS